MHYYLIIICMGFLQIKIGCQIYFQNFRAFLIVPTSAWWIACPEWNISLFQVCFKKIFSVLNTLYMIQRRHNVHSFASQCGLTILKQRISQLTDVLQECAVCPHFRTPWKYMKMLCVAGSDMEQNLPWSCTRHVRETTPLHGLLHMHLTVSLLITCRFS